MCPQFVLSDSVKRAEFDSKRNMFQDMPEDADSESSPWPKRAAGEVCNGHGDVDEKQERKIGSELGYGLSEHLG